VKIKGTKGKKKPANIEYLEAHRKLSGGESGKKRGIDMKKKKVKNKIPSGMSLKLDR